MVAARRAVGRVASIVGVIVRPVPMGLPIQTVPNSQLLLCWLRVATTESMPMLAVTAVVRVACAVITSEESMRISACAQSTACAGNDSNLVGGATVSARPEALVGAVDTNWLPNVLATVSTVGLDSVSVKGHAMAIARVMDLSV